MKRMYVDMCIMQLWPVGSELTHVPNSQTQNQKSLSFTLFSHELELEISSTVSSADKSFNLAN